MNYFVDTAVSRSQHGTGLEKDQGSNERNEELKRQFLIIVLLIVIFIPNVTSAKTDRFSACLPDGVTPKSEVVDNLSHIRFDNTSQIAKQESNRKPKTVQSILMGLKAQCKNGTLTDRNGKEIRIVQLIGCWGNPPEDYQEQIDRQHKEIEQLGEKYIVIQIPCEPTKHRS